MSKLNELIKAREEAYKCPEYRKLEKAYLSFEYEYTKDDDFIEALEDEGVNTEKYRKPENLKAEEVHEEVTMKARDDHVFICKTDSCTNLRNVQIAYDQEKKK